MVDEEVVEGMDWLVESDFEVEHPVVQVVAMPEHHDQPELDWHGYASDVLYSHCMSGMFDHSQQN